MTCARCGAQNPDGNLYCQVCGTSLTAAPPPPPPSGPPAGAPPGPPPGPPPGMAPPAFAGPPGYASPYYSPAVPTAPVHRTPWTLIIAAVVALVILMAGFGTALALIGARPPSTNGGGIAELPSPTPATSPSPVGSPTTVPTGPATQSNDGLSVVLPVGWTVADRDNETLVLSDPNNEGDVTVASGASSPPQTAQDNKSSIDAELKSKYPDTRNCPGTTTTNGSFNGAKGISWTLCGDRADAPGRPHQLPEGCQAGARHGALEADVAGARV